MKCLCLVVQNWEGVGMMLCLKLVEICLNIVVFSYAINQISWVWYLYWVFLFALLLIMVIYVKCCEKISLGGIL